MFTASELASCSEPSVPGWPPCQIPEYPSFVEISRLSTSTRENRFCTSCARLFCQAVAIAVEKPFRSGDRNGGEPPFQNSRLPKCPTPSDHFRLVRMQNDTFGSTAATDTPICERRGQGPREAAARMSSPTAYVFRKRLSTL